MAKPEMSPYLRFLGYDWYEVSAESVAENRRIFLACRQLPQKKGQKLGKR